MNLNLQISEETLDLASKVAKDVAASLGYPDSRPSFEWYLSVARQVQRLGDIGQKTKFDLRKCKMLEIGSGLGMFLCVANKLGIDCYGLGPSCGAYSAESAGAKSLLSYNDVSEDRLVNAFGERMPFGENCFDVVVCFDVIEHVQSPVDLIEESLRVLRPGGYFYAVGPSYSYFWEYHYAIPWFPWIPAWATKYWVRTFRRNPDFLNQLNFVTPWRLRKWLDSIKQANVLQIFDYDRSVSKPLDTRDGKNDWLEDVKFTEVIEMTGASRNKRFPKILQRFFRIPVIRTLQRKLSLISEIKLVIRKKQDDSLVG